MKTLSNQAVTTLKRLLFCACLIPFARLAAGAPFGLLGPDPAADILRSTGIWALRLLLLMLAFTPARRLTGWQWLARLRRTVALYAFFYACLHLLAYLLFEQFFDWPEIAKDITKRPHIFAGLLAYTLMVPLAITSTNAMMKRIGGKNWQRLHRLSYLIAASAVFHYFWLVKRDITPPSLYALILIALLGARLLKKPQPRMLFGKAARA